MSEYNNRILNKISSDLATTRGIIMTYAYDFNHRGIYLEMSKNNYHIRKVITDFEIVQMKGELFDHIRKMVDQLEAATEKQQGTQTMSIPLPEGWLSKELNMENDISIEGQIVPVTINIDGGAITIGSGGGGSAGGMTFPAPSQGTNTMTETQTVPVGFEERDMSVIARLKATARTVIMNSLTAKGILAGGCFTSWWHIQDPRDYDIFVIDEIEKEYLVHFVAADLNRFKLSDKAYMSNDKIENVFLDTKTNIQYILVSYTTRQEVIGHFDAEHACVSYDPIADKLYASPLTIDCIKNKLLKNHNQNKIAPWRVHKFTQRGFKKDTVLYI